MSVTPDPPRRARHLIDFDNPPKMPNTKSTENVQRWILSTLAASSVLHLNVGITLLTLRASMPEGERIAMLVLNAVVGMGAIAVAFALHHKNPLNPWILIGLAPALVGAWLLYAR